MRPRKLIGWGLIAVALVLMVAGDFGTPTFLSALLVKLAAMTLVAVGMIMVAT